MKKVRIPLHHDTSFVGIHVEKHKYRENCIFSLLEKKRNKRKHEETG